MTKKIEFIYTGEYAFEVCDHIKPSKETIPDWFKQMQPFDGEQRLRLVEGRANYSAKRCVPMFDAIQAGYLVTTWADVLIERDEQNEALISWRVTRNVFERHGMGARLIPPMAGYDQQVFKYLAWFSVRTPKGYSIMVTPPAGHYDLPFYPISAVIDTDRNVINMNFPVWPRSGLEGVVEKGTPICQITPFKRESWQAAYTYETDEAYIRREDKGFQSTLVNNYRKNIWSRKDYS